jgi:hypothetical protein
MPSGKRKWADATIAKKKKEGHGKGKVPKKSSNEKCREHEQLENQFNFRKELQQIVDEELMHIDTSRPGYSAVQYRPGVRFQLDAIVCDFYLVSNYNFDWILGRPVLYFVSDEFSQKIVGYYVGIEGPSWHGFMMAIANAATDKVAHCKEYGIEINPSEWNCRYIPDILISHNGELMRKPFARLVKTLDVTIEYAPPISVNFKGIVERDFGAFHHYTRRFTPGFIVKDYKRGTTRDYRLDAKLNLFTFNKIIIKYILAHNNKLEIPGYSRTKRMIEDNVLPIPKDIWNWGIENGLGKLKEIDEDFIKLNLFPIAQATVTHEGIRFKKMLYTCDEAEKEKWFLTAHKKGPWKVEISYDPRNMNKIYLREKGKDGVISCTLCPHQEKYMNTELSDIEYLHEQEKFEKKKREFEQLQSQINLAIEVKHILDKELNKHDSVSEICDSKKLKE